MIIERHVILYLYCDLYCEDEDTGLEMVQPCTRILSETLKVTRQSYRVLKIAPTMASPEFHMAGDVESRDPFPLLPPALWEDHNSCLQTLSPSSLSISYLSTYFSLLSLPFHLPFHLPLLLLLNLIPPK